MDILSPEMEGCEGWEITDKAQIQGQTWRYTLFILGKSIYSSFQGHLYKITQKWLIAGTSYIAATVIDYLSFLRYSVVAIFNEIFLDSAELSQPWSDP